MGSDQHDLVHDLDLQNWWQDGEDDPDPCWYTCKKCGRNFDVGPMNFDEETDTDGKVTLTPAGRAALEAFLAKPEASGGPGRCVQVVRTVCGVAPAPA